MSYDACNAVLYDVISFAEETGKEGAIAEVAMAIVRIVEAVKKEGQVSWAEVEKILEEKGNLEAYLNTVTV